MRKKLLLKRLVVIFLFFSVSTAISQQIKDILISATADRQPLPLFLQHLEDQYHVEFYFKEEWFADEVISVELSCKSIDKALAIILEGKPFQYEIIENNIVVFMPKEQVAMITGQMLDLSGETDQGNTIEIGNPDEAGKFKEVTLTGLVSDGKTGESLIGATIKVANTNKGVITDFNGKYSIVLQPGIYKLYVSNIGYERNEYRIKIIGNGSLDVDLVNESIKLDEVSVYAMRADRNIRSSRMSVVEMDSKTIKHLPALIGERDILKSLTMMAGVKSVGEFGSGINVRGGGEDQNLYLVEGAPVFNTSHVFGLLSVINPDAVSNVTLYKGHIPAKYGERVSSVMDIQIKDNNCKEWHAKGGIGIFNSRLMVEGSLLDDKITLKIGGRTSYSDWLLNQIEDYYLKNSSASFYDVNALLNFNLKRHKISLFGYMSNDQFKYADILKYQYGNMLGSFNWKFFFNDNLSSNLSVAYSRYNVEKDDLESTLEQDRITSEVEYATAKYDMKFTGLNRHTIDFGIQAIQYKIAPGEQTPLDDESLAVAKILEEEQAYEAGIYVNDLYEINDRFTLNAGIRYSVYNYVGPRTVMLYSNDATKSDISVIDSVVYNTGESIKQYSGIEPRVSLKIQINNTSSTKISYNRNFQYISLVSYTSISTPDDIWKLSDNYLEPIIADQFAIGYYKNFENNTFETSVEVYYKKLTNLIEYKNNAELEMNQNIETELTEASGNNYGVEFMVKKNSGKFEGWLSYTWSRSMKQTNGKYKSEIINDNEIYSSSYDKPHDLTCMGIYHFNRRWRISANFSLMSGRAVTLPEYKYKVNQSIVVYYSDRNKYRLPTYHRLDLSVSLDETLRIKKKWKGRWTFSILNVYARKNAYSVFYKKEEPTIANDYETYSLYKLYIIGKPMPTITYNFIF